MITGSNRKIRGSTIPAAEEYPWSFHTLRGAGFPACALLGIRKTAKSRSQTTFSHFPLRPITATQMWELLVACIRLTIPGMTGESSADFYRRRLPHYQPNMGSVFITWRLFGSPPPPPPSGRIGLDFVRHDRQLEADQRGPHWLKNPEIAELVLNAIHTAAHQQKRFHLCAWVIMPNHVHLLITPFQPLHRITQGLKGYTARRANQVLNRSRCAFWQDESFDHWIRDEYEFLRVVDYIEQNPVKAGLVRNAEEWPWSSIHAR